ncbi:hypothetical protein [Priestia flexa]|uniref:hypothetical protein n=1 Tax=Priestia flexa TaxID=86664 RepID=UPI0004732329|nr:hypothetical protein [Priestia flexa]
MVLVQLNEYKKEEKEINFSNSALDQLLRKQTKEREKARNKKIKNELMKGYMSLLAGYESSK